MSKGKLQLSARPAGRRGQEAAQTEWMYLLFMWKSMGPDRWRFVSSLFTPRLLDKCPRCPSLADAAQVSREPSFLLSLQMDDRCASYRPVRLSPLKPCPCLCVDQGIANKLELVSKEGLLVRDMSAPENLVAFIFMRKHSAPRQNVTPSTNTEFFFKYVQWVMEDRHCLRSVTFKDRYWQIHEQ